MARPRKPSNILELKGAFKRNPSRGGREKMNPYQREESGIPACWHEIVG
jgi:hypothetical protein